MLLLCVLFYAADVWTLLSTVAAALRVFERKVLRKMFTIISKDFRIRFNIELYQLHNNMDVAQRINIQRLRLYRLNGGGCFPETGI